MTNEEAKVLIESNLKETKSEKKSLLLNELRRLGIFELVANSVTAIISGAVPSDAVKERLIAHGIVSGGAAVIDLIYALIDSKDEFENNRDKIMLLKKYQYELKNNVNRFQDIEAKDFKMTIYDDLCKKKIFR